MAQDIDDDIFAQIVAQQPPETALPVQIQTGAVARPKQTGPRFRPARDEVQNFVLVPVEWVRGLKGLNATVDLAFELLSQGWWDATDTVVVSNQLLARAGISRTTRWRVLKRLEQRGLIVATQQGRQAPRAALQGQTKRFIRAS